MIDHPNLPVVVSEYEHKWVEGLNSGDISVAQDVFHPDCTIHINGAPVRDLDLDGFKQMIAGMLVAFPDLHFTIMDQFSSGKKFSTRWKARGTHMGPLGDIQPTGKTAEIEGFIVDYVVDGKVEERWELWDQAAMMQQLGSV